MRRRFVAVDSFVPAIRRHTASSPGIPALRPPGAAGGHTTAAAGCESAPPGSSTLVKRESNRSGEGRSLFADIPAPSKTRRPRKGNRPYGLQGRAPGPVCRLHGRQPPGVGDAAAERRCGCVFWSAVRVVHAQLNPRVWGRLSPWRAHRLCRQRRCTLTPVARGYTDSPLCKRHPTLLPRPRLQLACWSTPSRHAPACTRRRCMASVRPGSPPPALRPNYPLPSLPFDSRLPTRRRPPHAFLPRP